MYNNKVSKDFLEWYQERIKGMTPEEFKQYVMGGSGVFHEPTEEECETVDKIAAKYMGKYPHPNIHDLVPFDKENKE